MTRPLVRTLLRVAAVTGLCRAGRRRRSRTGRRSGRHGRCRRGASSSRPTRSRRCANGLQVIAVSHHEQPAVSLRLIVRAGGAQDPADKPGVADARRRAARSGDDDARTPSRSPASIDSIGGAVGTGAGSDSVVHQCRRDEGQLGLRARHGVGPGAAPGVRARGDRAAAAADALRAQGRLRGSRLHRRHGVRSAGLRLPPVRPAGLWNARVASPASRATTSWRFTRRASAPTTPSSPSSATSATKRRLPAPSARSATGGRRRAATPSSADPPAPTRRVVVIDRPGAVQTEIRVGNIGLPRRHKDYLALDLAINILGGEGGNRLHRVLRSDRGLTYGASADVNALKDAGNIVADTDTRSEVDRRGSSAHRRRVLAPAAAAGAGRRARRCEGLPDGQLSPDDRDAERDRAADSERRLLRPDLNELQTYRERVNAISADDIQRVAREYLRPDRLSIVLVGDASAFTKQLAGAGFDHYERIALSDLDLGSADLKRHGPPANRYEPAAFRITAPALAPRQTPSQAPRAPAASAEPVRDLIARAVQAKGGLEKLRSIRTIKATATTTTIGAVDGPVDCRDDDLHRVSRRVPRRCENTCGHGRPDLQGWRVLDV